MKTGPSPSITSRIGEGKAGIEKSSILRISTRGATITHFVLYAGLVQEPIQLFDEEKGVLFPPLICRHVHM